MKQRGYTYDLRLGWHKDTPDEKAEIWAFPISLHDIGNRTNGVSAASALNRALPSIRGIVHSLRVSRPALLLRRRSPED
jgi:hypothetical protein